MSYRPDACDAALLAWANACLQHHSDEAAPTLEAVVDTNSLSLMCKKFNLGDPEQGARRQSAAQRRRRVAEALNSCRVGLVEPSMAELGGPAAARSLTAGILLVAVEAPTKEEAIQFIVTLDQSQQAELAQVIQQLMDATGDKKDLVDEKAADLTPRISVRNRRFSDVQIAGNDPKVVEPLQAEAHELRRTLDRHTQDVLEKQQVQLSMADKVAEAKALLCGEADRCVDLFQELDAKETEHRSLSRDLVSLKEEMRHENAIASNHSEALKELSAQVEEERRRCRSIQMRQIDLKAEVDQAHHSVARVEASSWKRTALQAKLTRLQERLLCDRTRLGELQRNFRAEEACSSSLGDELQQAEESLTQRNTILTTWEESVSNSEGVLQEAESELDSCTQELKAMNSEDLDGLHVEIEKKSQALARAEQTTAETIAQRALIGQQIVEVGAVLQEERHAEEEATDLAKAEALAAQRALQKLHLLSDEATTAAQDVADLATRKPRASLMLLGAPLADDALRWQKINEELVHTEVEVKTAESRSHHLGLELSEASEELTRCRMHEEAAKAEEEERQAATAAGAADAGMPEADTAEEGLTESMTQRELLRLQGQVQVQEDSLQALLRRNDTLRHDAERLEAALGRASGVLAKAREQEERITSEAMAEAQVLAEINLQVEAAEAGGSSAEAMRTAATTAALKGDAAAEEFRPRAAAGAAAVAEAAQEVKDEVAGKADFSAMVKRANRAPVSRAAKDAAASKLQARQRGIMARSKIAALRVPRRSEHEAEVDQGHPDGSVVVPSVRTAKDVSYQRLQQPLPPAKREERERAVIKLQALERGILARAQVQRLRDARATKDAPKAAKKASRLSSSSRPREVSRLGVGEVLRGASGPSVEVLQEQIQLRQQELAFKELQAQEDEALHAREVSLLASSLHRLGMRYGRLLGQCQALEALVPERVRRMNEGSSSNARSNARP